MVKCSKCKKIIEEKERVRVIRARRGAYGANNHYARIVRPRRKNPHYHGLGSVGANDIVVDLCVPRGYSRRWNIGNHRNPALSPDEPGMVLYCLRCYKLKKLKE